MSESQTVHLRERLQVMPVSEVDHVTPSWPLAAQRDVPPVLGVRKVGILPSARFRASALRRRVRHQGPAERTHPRHSRRAGDPNVSLLTTRRVGLRRGFLGELVPLFFGGEMTKLRAEYSRRQERQKANLRVCAWAAALFDESPSYHLWVPATRKYHKRPKQRRMFEYWVNEFKEGRAPERSTQCAARLDALQRECSSLEFMILDRIDVQSPTTARRIRATRQGAHGVYGILLEETGKRLRALSRGTATEYSHDLSESAQIATLRLKATLHSQLTLAGRNELGTSWVLRDERSEHPAELAPPAPLLRDRHDIRLTVSPRGCEHAAVTLDSFRDDLSAARTLGIVWKHRRSNSAALVRGTVSAAQDWFRGAAFTWYLESESEVLHGTNSEVGRLFEAVSTQANLVGLIVRSDEQILEADFVSPRSDSFGRVFVFWPASRALPTTALRQLLRLIPPLHAGMHKAPAVATAIEYCRQVLSERS